MLILKIKNKFKQPFAFDPIIVLFKAVYSKRKRIGTAIEKIKEKWIYSC